jgi:lipid-A-disaccharide synthase
MSERRLTIFLSAAEASGDLHASNLIRAIRRRQPQVRFVGLAGPRMAEAGCEVVADVTTQARMASVPLLRLGHYWRLVRRLQRTIRRLRPDLHIPVDSPALNWHLAAAAKDSGAKVFYYIAPQLWAWGPWRVKKLARLTDGVGCILPFEQAYLRHRGVHATYVGHPLFDTMPPRPEPPADLAAAWLDGAWRVALLAGSRPGEIAGHTPAFLAAAERIRRRWRNARCVFAAPTDACAEAIRRAGGGDADIAVGRTRQVLAASHFAIAVSGTVTLEAAYFGVPMVVVYRVPYVRYHLAGRWLVRTPHVCLVNILAGRRVVPELVPWYGGRRALVEMVTEVMDDYGWLCEVRKDLMAITDPLRAAPPQTASDNAAQLALRTVGR